MTEINDQNDSGKEIIELGSEITGSVAGTAIGFWIAGPSGAYIGAIASPVFANVFKKYGAEIKKWFLGDREKIRIGASYTYAFEKFNKNLIEGKVLRHDNFFEAKGANRSNAEEILEGILITAQKSYEEKKIRFIGNLYANIAFDSSVDVGEANHFIKLSEQFSFRQYCFIGLFAKNSFNSVLLNKLRKNFNTNRIDAITEIAFLCDKGIFRKLHQNFPNYNPTPNSNLQRIESLSSIKLTQFGERYYNFMNFNEIVESDLEMLDYLKYEIT
jgi:hypothetical protein